VGKGRMAVTTTQSHFRFPHRHGPPTARALSNTSPSVEDYQVAMVTYRAVTAEPITLRQGARVIEDSRRMPTASPNNGSREGGR
jgi:hypothetical protein